MKYLKLSVLVFLSLSLGACVKLTNIPSMSDMDGLLHPAKKTPIESSSKGNLSSDISDDVMMGFKAAETANKYNQAYDAKNNRKGQINFIRPLALRYSIISDLGQPSRSELFVLKHKDKFSGKILEAKREALYYDSSNGTVVFLLSVVGDKGQELIDHFKKPRANYSYPRNIDPNMGISAPD